MKNNFEKSLGGQEAFHGGTTTILNVFTAEDAVTSAEDSESEAHIAYMHALVDLYEALGGGWTEQQTTAPTPRPDATGETTTAVR
jgi:outer membrane protein TolC